MALIIYLIGMLVHIIILILIAIFGEKNVPFFRFNREKAILTLPVYPLVWIIIIIGLFDD